MPRIVGGRVFSDSGEEEYMVSSSSDVQGRTPFLLPMTPKMKLSIMLAEGRI